ncbi:MAG: MFS transporter [archaeon]
MAYFKKGELNLLWKFYLETLITNMFLISQIFVTFYFLDIGFSLIKIGILFSVISLSMLIFEIPTGAFSDIYGRKISVIIGYFLLAMLFILMNFTTNFYLILIIYFLMGASYTFISGAYEAWVCDNLIYNKRKDLIKEFFIKNRSILNLATIILGIVSAIFVKLFSLKIIWIISFIAQVLGLFIFLFIKEYKFKTKNHKINILNQAKSSINLSFKNKIIKLLIICSFFTALWISFGGAANTLWQPFFKELNFKEYLFGFVFTISGIIGIFSPYLIKYLNKVIPKDNILLAITQILFVFFLIFVLFVNEYIFAIIIFLIIFAIKDISFPLQEQFFQLYLPSRNRATITSTRSMVKSIAFIIGSPLAAFLAQLIGLKLAIALSGLILIPSIIIYFNLNKI